jgi:hypothetical protein
MTNAPARVFARGDADADTTGSCRASDATAAWQPFDLRVADAWKEESLGERPPGHDRWAEAQGRGVASGSGGEDVVLDQGDGSPAGAWGG